MSSTLSISVSNELGNAQQYFEVEDKSNTTATTTTTTTTTTNNNNNNNTFEVQ